MKSGWVAEHAPPPIVLRQLRERLRIALPDGDQAGFIEDAERIIAIYRARKIDNPKPIETRSAQRYLRDIATGKSPRAKLTGLHREVFDDQVRGYRGDAQRAATAALRSMSERRSGRPSAHLEDWLIACTARMYRHHFGADISIGKRSEFARSTLYSITQAAGIMGSKDSIGDRIAGALETWPDPR